MGITVHATVFIVMLSATVTCMNIPEKFVNRVVQDEMNGMLEAEFQDIYREALMNCVRQNWLGVTKCSTKCDAISIKKKSDQMMACMFEVAEMDTPLNYTEREYLSSALTAAAGVSRIR